LLHDFIRTHRDELIARARAKVALRSAPRPTEHELVHGVPQFLSQVEAILALEANDSSPDGAEMAASASQHGRDLLEEGFSVGQVVHDYGDVCQAVTQLAVDRNVPIDTAEFRTLNRCLDNAIASAVTEYTSQREATLARGEVERLGFFAHELRNLLGASTLAFHALKRGDVGINGTTGAVLQRNLTSLARLIDRSLSEVRLSVGVLHRERVSVPEFFEDIEIGASLEAKMRKVELTVDCTNCDVSVDVDRHLLASAVSNLLQNAMKFTRPHGHVRLGAETRDGRVVIEVEDECGGLPVGKAETLFQPFTKPASDDHSGLGLGLAISHRAVHANHGSIAVRDLPARGCVFSIEIPVAKGLAPGDADGERKLRAARAGSTGDRSR
jgi:hypothetical protein